MLYNNRLFPALKLAHAQSMPFFSFNNGSCTFAYKRLPPGFNRSLSIVNNFVREYLDLIVSRKMHPIVKGFGFPTNLPDEQIKKVALEI